MSELSNEEFIFETVFLGGSFIVILLNELNAKSLISIGYGVVLSIEFFLVLISGVICEFETRLLFLLWLLILFVYRV